MSEDYGYGVVEENEYSGNRYLTLKKKGDKVRVRLLTPPLHNFRYWETGPDGKGHVAGTFPTRDECKAEVEAKYPEKDTRPRIEVQYGWLVIDRADGAVKVFKGGQQIASGIKAIVDSGKLDENGTPIPDTKLDPTTVDITIERTEENPYYKVLPVLQAPRPLNDDEKKLLAESGIDLKAEMEGGTASKSHDAETYGGAVELETLPEQPVEKAEGDVDVEADDDGDMPF